MAIPYASNSQLKHDIARGKERQSRLIDFNNAIHTDDGKGEREVLWLWQYWQGRVTAYPRPEHRKDFMSFGLPLRGPVTLRTLSRQVADCVAKQTAFVEGLIHPASSV